MSQAKVADFLVEVGTEELPPKALRELEQAFETGLRTAVTAAGLGYESLQSFATPRRLAVRIGKLMTRQPDQLIKRRGPPMRAAYDAAGAPTRAATAFAASCNVPLGELGRERDEQGNEYLYYSGSKPGADARSLLPAMVSGALDSLPIPKRMRWGAGEAQFVRPVHWLVMLLDEQVVEGTVLDTVAGNVTRGHRFMAPKALKISAPARYEATLERGKVIASFAARRARVHEQVLAEATALQGRALIEEALLDEVTALVEWPVALAGQFDQRFLELPREVLISTLQDHQRYFPVEDGDGRLLPWFITVSNIESRNPAAVRAGNERVVRPRLSDAAFFWQQDRKQPLAWRRAGLDQVTYQAKLGSVGDKVRRVQTLALEIGPLVGADPVYLARAAEFCKCDLLTQMVGEFPELQGIMGRYYAQADGEPADVTEAIREHYLPRGAGDALPNTATGLALALADRLDTLVGIFAIGQKPSGTRDPFGLRRAAIGVLRMSLERSLPLHLRRLLALAARELPASVGAIDQGNLVNEVLNYILERLRAQLLESQSCSTEMFDAVLATAASSPADFQARIKALADFLQLPEAASLAAANKRIANILRKSTAARGAAPDAALLREPAERALYEAMCAAQPVVERSLADARYTDALSQLASLRGSVDAFFEHVMVNDEDAALRGNRLALLAQLRALFSGVADLSKLPG